MPYLLIVATFSFIFSSISILFNYYEVQGWNMIWQLIWLLSNILVFLIYKYFNFSINDFFLIYSIKQSLLYIIGIFLFIIYAKKIYEA
jgi:cytochrome c oxidase subunit IV